jgi:P-type Mg2+ transporter
VEYWTFEAGEALRRLASTPLGLSSVEAANRLKVYGPNKLSEQRSLSRAQVAWSQLKNPLVLILVFAAVVSAMTGGWVDSFIVFSIVVVSAWLGYSREYKAQTTAAELRIRTRAHASVLRDGGSPSPSRQSCLATSSYSLREAWCLRTAWCSNRPTSS